MDDLLGWWVSTLDVKKVVKKAVMKDIYWVGKKVERWVGKKVEMLGGMSVEM